MSSNHRIAHFRLEKLISENNLTQSWYATDLRAGRKCFVKSPVEHPSIDPDSVNSILARSFDCQKKVWSRKLLTAIGRHSGNGRLLIVYPCLDSSRWTLLTPTLFWQRFPRLLLEAGIVIDYLHLTGLVHGDLKLGNLLVNCRHEKEQVKLIDLDLLTSCHSSPEAKILGTPEHVAPEILENDLITGESDNYSIGVSLKAYIRALEEEPSLLDPKRALHSDNLATLADSLTKTDRLLRPRILVEAFYRHNIIDRQAFESALKRLLAMRLSTTLRNHRIPQSRKRANLGEFLVKDAGVFGLPEELASDLGQAFEKNRVATMLLFWRLVQKATVVLFGDYWQISVSDGLCGELFARAEEISHGKRAGRLMKKAGNAESRSQLVAKALRLNRAESYLKSFLCLKLALGGIDQTDLSSTKERRRILVELGRLAMILNRPQAAIDFMTSCLDLVDSPDERLKILQDLTYLCLSTRRFREAYEFIDRGQKEAKSHKNIDLELHFQKQRAWAMSALGEFVGAQELYGALLERVTALGLTRLLVGLYNDLGTLAWRQSHFLQSKAYFEKGFNLAKDKQLLSEVVTLPRNLSVLCLELSEYKKAVEYGRLALRSLVNPSDKIILPFICSTIAAGYVRLGQYRKAEYWLQRSVAGMSLLLDRIPFGDYYQLVGWLQMAQGKLTAAKESQYKALEALHSAPPGKAKGKAYHILAEIALYEGDYEACIRHIDQARIVFEKLGDHAASAEIELLGQLNNFYYGDTGSPSNLITQLESLLSLNCCYYAVLCLYHILIRGDSGMVRAALHTALALKPLIESGETPLFRAVAELTASYNREGTDGHPDSEVMKTVYRTLNRAGHSFLALIVCERIAASYADASNTKLAKKFLNHSLKLARTLQNERFVKELSVRIQAISQTAPDQQRLLTSIHGISEILKSITSYEEALQKVVKYAVDETGAERGVLLLKPDDNSEMHVKASVGCDELSLPDVKDFSTRIPQDVAKDHTPLIIENALTDKRTKGYKSIVAHNIMSVICMPIIIKDKLLGVLYLDHHTIPALFDRDDITFASSIANFVSIILAKIQEFKTISLTTNRLQDELSRGGFHQPVITQNRSMLDMLSRFPQIARTNASVLVVGESGTGKEILCEMIHDLSLRSDAPLVKLNCAAISSTLIESELFGVAKNVATGVGEREGKFSAADGGTLFLDEIGDLPPEIQAKVLRVLEYQEFEKVGSNRTISTDIRFVYATNKDLKKLIAKGEFREDLYYRINTIAIEVPPLRERTDDILLLVEHFTKLFAPDEKSYPRLSAAAIESLLDYSWPGNVRELRNLVERLCILRPHMSVEVSDLPKEFLAKQSSDSRNRRSAQATEKAAIREALIADDWNQSKVARIMGIPLTTLRRKIKKYDITRQL